MIMPAFLLFSLVPGGLLLWVGQRIEQRQPAEDAMRRLFHFLLAAFMLLWIGLIALDYDHPSSLWSVILIPVMTGIVPITYMLWRSTPSLRTRQTAMTLLMTVALLALLSAWFVVVRGGYYLPLLIIGSGGVITVTWQAAQSRGMWRRLAWGALVALIVGAGVYHFASNALLATWPDWVQHTLELSISLFLPVVTATLIGRLAYMTAQDSIQWRQILIGLGMVGVMSALLITHISEAAVLDWATDGLNAVTLMMFMSVTSLAVTLLLAWGLRVRRIITPMIYVIVMAVAISAVYFIATRSDPQRVNLQRAEQVRVAIQSYHADTGQYPADLSALIPRYALSVPDPVLFRNQSWCYAGGADYFRFGYVYRPSFAASVDQYALRMYDSAGTLPEAESWSCELDLNAR